jgi:hypothetical protein
MAGKNTRRFFLPTKTRFKPIVPSSMRLPVSVLSASRQFERAAFFSGKNPVFARLRAFTGRTILSRTSNRFFRLRYVRLHRFSNIRRIRRFYRKRWSLQARTGFGSIYKNFPQRSQLFSTRLFFSSARLGSLQFLRASYTQKHRVYNLLKFFSTPTDHPILRFGSRRSFHRSFTDADNRYRSLFSSLTTSSNRQIINNSGPNNPNYLLFRLLIQRLGWFTSIFFQQTAYGASSTPLFFANASV